MFALCKLLAFSALAHDETGICICCGLVFGLIVVGLIVRMGKAGDLKTFALISVCLFVYACACVCVFACMPAPYLFLFFTASENLQQLYRDQLDLSVATATALANATVNWQKVE